MNILVLDTEVYSNTGGQSSKPHVQAQSPSYSSRKACSEKRFRIYCYDLWQCLCSTDQLQCICSTDTQSIPEAEAYPGVSLIIAYSPCIAHGIKGGMGKSGNQGGWQAKIRLQPVYTYDPRLEKEVKSE